MTRENIPWTKRPLLPAETNMMRNIDLRTDQTNEKSVNQAFGSWIKGLLNIGLLVVAVALAIVLLPTGLGYTFWWCILVMSPRKAYGYLSNTALAIATAIDILGNVVCRDLLNDTLITPNGYRFGKQGETISSVLGKNKARRTLTKQGQKLTDALNWLDKKHVEKAALYHRHFS